jgi:hypothetical protein
MTSALPDESAITIQQEDACFENYAYVNTIYQAYIRGLPFAPHVVPGIFTGCQTAKEVVLDRILSRPLSVIANRSSPLALSRCLLVRALMGCDFELDDLDGTALTHEDAGSSISRTGSGGEVSSENVGLDAIVDIAEDLLALSVRRGFSVSQVQELLLLFQQTFQDVVGVNVSPSDTAAEEAELEGRVAKRLTNRIIALTSVSRKLVAEKVVKIETIVEEVVDATLVAALEAKKDPKGNKKQLQAIEDAIRTLPKMKVEKKVPVEVMEVVEVDIPPAFSLPDCALILDLITSSLFVHWRLFRQLGLEPRLVSEKIIVVRQKDVFPALLPALATAMTESEFVHFTAREGLVSAAEEQLRLTFSELFEKPMASLCEKKREMEGHVEQLKRQAEAADIENQLSAEEYRKAVEVLTNRATKKVAHSYVPKPPAATGPAAAVTTSSNTPPSATPGVSPAVAATPGAASNPPSPASVRCDTSSDSSGKAGLVLFSLEDVSSRLQKLSDVLSTSSAAGGSSPAAAGGGKKK